MGEEAGKELLVRMFTSKISSIAYSGDVDFFMGCGVEEGGLCG